MSSSIEKDGPAPSTSARPAEELGTKAETAPKPKLDDSVKMEASKELDDSEPENNPKESAKKSRRQMWKEAKAARANAKAGKDPVEDAGPGVIRSFIVSA
jgi:hypothetical protein